MFFPKKLTAGIVVVMLLFGALFIIPTGNGDTNESSFGEWKVDVEAVNKDGNIQKMQTVDTIGGQLLGFYHDNKEFSKIRYTLSAKATGKGYSTCHLDLTQVHFNCYVNDHIVEGNVGETVDLPVNGDFQELFTMTVTSSDMSSYISSPGTYTVVFETTGDGRFKGTVDNGDDGPWQDVSSIPRTTTEVTWKKPVCPVDFEVLNNNINSARFQIGSKVKTGKQVTFQMQPGKYDYKVSKSGYYSETGTIDVDIDGSYSYHFRLDKIPPPSPEYDFHINTNPSGAQITLTGKDVSYKKTKTSDCTFYNLDPGTYNWEASKSGYHTETAPRTIDSDTTITIVLTEPDEYVLTIRVEGFPNDVSDINVKDSNGNLIRSGVIHGTGAKQYTLSDGSYKIKCYERTDSVRRTKNIHLDSHKLIVFNLLGFLMVSGFTFSVEPTGQIKDYNPRPGYYLGGK